MYGYYGYGPTYIGGPQLGLGALPSEAEFVVHANKLAHAAARQSPVGRGQGNRWYMLLAKRIAEGQTDLSFNETEVSRDLAGMRYTFREMTEGRSDGQPLFAFVSLYTFDGHAIVDSQWWADARYVVTMNVAPMTAADRAARSILGTQ